MDEDGDITLRYTWLFPAGVSKRQVNLILGFLLQAINSHYPAFAKLLWGGVGAEEAWAYGQSLLEDNSEVDDEDEDVYYETDTEAEDPF